MIDQPVQLSIDSNSLESMVDTRCAAAHEEIRRMTADAIEFINRSAGQRIRYARERIERDAKQFWKERNTTVEIA